MGQGKSSLTSFSPSCWKSSVEASPKTVCRDLPSSTFSKVLFSIIKNSVKAISVTSTTRTWVSSLMWVSSGGRKFCNRLCPATRKPRTKELKLPKVSSVKLWTLPNSSKCSTSQKRATSLRMDLRPIQGKINERTNLKRQSIYLIVVVIFRNICMVVNK